MRGGTSDGKLKSSTARGYGTQHQAERRIWAKEIAAAGGVPCRRGTACIAPNLIIQADDDWDLGHPDQDCPAPKAPEHRACNRSAGGRNGAAATHAAHSMTVRNW